eukprot:g24108.t1
MSRTRTFDPSAGPDQRARGVLNALIKVEGEHFPAVMADFLQKGGVSALQEGTELLRHPGFADFISKLLWIAWDVQQVFFAESSRPEALALLSQLFVCPSKGARVCAGLLLANALCHDQLGAERNAAQAAEGLRQLTEEMASLGSWESQEPEDVEVRNLVQGLGQNAERFGRILTCAQAPWEQNQGQLPDEGSPLWPGATFSLWCLLRMKPDPSRLSQLRPALPAVAQGAPPRARWLAGELLLQLQLQVPSQLDSKMDAIVETSIQDTSERTALELSLQEMFEHTRRSLQSELGESSQVIETQQRLLELRQQPLPMATGSSVAGSGWHQPLEAALAKLQTAREELSRALTDAARQRETAQSAVHDVLEMELTTDSAEDWIWVAESTQDQQMDQQLQCMRQTEAEYTARHSEQEQQSSLLKSQEEEVATANTAMEAADKVLQEMRSRIAGYEADISSRQREECSTSAPWHPQTCRPHGISSRVSWTASSRSRRSFANVLYNSNLRDKTRRTRPGRWTASRQRPAAASVDPQQLEQQAQAAEHAVQHLGEQRDDLRGQLQSLEEDHAQARSEWQQAVSRLQHARQEKEVADLQGSSLKRQLEGQWASWQPLWSKRLQAWRQRAQVLSKASKSTQLLSSAAQLAWDQLRLEAESRHEALKAIEELQQQLAFLAHDLSSIQEGRKLSSKHVHQGLLSILLGECWQ